MLLKVAVIDDRDSYRERFVTALVSDYSDKLEVTSYSSIHAFDESQVGNSSVDVMLVGSEMGDPQLDGRHGAKLVYLVDDKSITEVFGHPATCRYQKLDLIYRALLDATLDKFEFATFQSESVDDTAFISFFPASGGAGSSTLAAACALGAAKRGHHVFYLNLEMYGQTSLYFVADGQGNLSDALFAVLSRKQNVNMRIQSLVKHTPQGVYFLDSCRNPLDLADLNPDSVARLVRSIAASGGYDIVIIDLDYPNSDIAAAVMELSARTVFVSNGSEVSNCKFGRILDVLKAQSAGIRGSIADVLNNVVLTYNNFDVNTGSYIDDDTAPVLGVIATAPVASEAQLVDVLSSSHVVDELLNVEVATTAAGR